MDVGRVRQAGEIFHEAVLRGEGDRGSYVTTACGQDAELRHEVESLLEADARGHSVLDASVWESMDAGELETALSGGVAAPKGKTKTPRRIRCTQGHFYLPEDGHCPFCGEGAAS